MAQLSLFQFSQQQNNPGPASPTLSLPLKIVWPSTAKIAVVGGQWQCLPDGQIEATYSNEQELEICITLSKWIKEWTEQPEPLQQAEMFPQTVNNYETEI